MSSQIPFLLSLDDEPFYNHDMFPNKMYRRLHSRQHIPLDLHTLGLIARLGAHGHHRPNSELAPLGSNTKKDLFEVHLDVGLFQPEELSVKVINNSVVVEGKHEEREDDHGHIERHFVRRYNLPKDYNPEKIISTLSADGVLTIKAPKLKENPSNEFVVPIQRTGPSELFLHKNEKQDAKENNGTVEEKK